MNRSWQLYFTYTDQAVYPLSLFTDVDMTFLLTAKKLFRYVFLDLPGAKKSSLSNGEETLRRFKVVITIFCFTIIYLNAPFLEKMQAASKLIMHIVANRHARSTC